MSEDVLKGNFKVKNPVKIEDKKDNVSVQQELKKRALASIGGSMVYMERTDLVWDGDNKAS